MPEPTTFTTFDRETYKANLRAKGIEVTDQEIDKFLKQKDIANTDFDDFDGDGISPEAKQAMPDILANRLFANVGYAKTAWAGVKASEKLKSGEISLSEYPAEMFKDVFTEEGPNYIGGNRSVNLGPMMDYWGLLGFGGMALGSLLNPTFSRTPLPEYYDDPEYRDYLNEEIVPDMFAGAQLPYRTKLDEYNVARGIAPERPLRKYQPGFGEDPGGEYTSQDYKSGALSVLGVGLWNALDMASLGLLEVYTPDVLEPVPVTTGEKVSAGVGGFAGMVVPFVGAKAGATKLVQNVGSRSMRKISKNIGTKTSDYLAKSSVTGQRFSRMTAPQQKAFFERGVGPIQKHVTNMDKFFKKGGTEDDFLKILDDLIDDGLRRALKGSDLLRKRPFNNLKQILRNEIYDSAGNLPAHNLERKISIALERWGVTAGGGRLSSLLANSIAEGVYFAAVETPMEAINYAEGFFDREGEINEGTTLSDIGKRASHAFVIGNLLGGVKSFIPGGASGANMQHALRRMTSAVKKANIGKYDVNTAHGRAAIGAQANHLINSGATKLLNDVSGMKAYFSHPDHIAKLISTPGGAKQLQTALLRVEKQFKKDWWPMMRREFVKDKFFSMGRMGLSSLVMTSNDYFIPGGMLFDPNIALDDKIISTLLGAYIGKNGSRLRYKNSKGEVREADIRGVARYSYNPKFQDLSRALDYMGASNDYHIFKQMVITEKMQNNYRFAEHTPDVQKLMKILSKQGLIVDFKTDPKKQDNPAVPEAHPLYHHLEMLYNHNFRILKPGTRMRNISELTSKEARVLEKLLLKTKFSDSAGGKGGGIHTPLDLHEILLGANKKIYKKLMDTHLSYAVRMYNILAGPAREVTTDTVPTMWHINKPEVDFQDWTSFDKFTRVQSMLQKWGYIKMPKQETQSYTLKPEKLKEVADVIAEAEAELNKIWYDSEPVEPGSFLWKDFGDATVNQLIDGQSHFYAVRKAQRMLWDLDNASGMWGKSSEGAKEDHGVELQNYIKNLFTDKNNMLYRSIDLAGEPNDAGKLRQFISSMREILSVHPRVRSPYFEGVGKNHVVEPAEVRNMMRLLEDNGIMGLTHFNADFVKEFTREIHNLALENDLLGSVRATDGMPFNDVDRSIIQHLYDSGIAHPNGQIIDIVDVVRDQLATWSTQIDKDPRQFGKYFGKSATDRLTMLHHSHTSYDFISTLENYARENKQDPIDAFNQVMEKFDSYLKPYVITSAVNKDTGRLEKRGLFKSAASESGIKGIMQPGDLSNLIITLDFIHKSNQKTSHLDLINRINEIKNGKDWDLQQTAFLHNLYRRYYDPKSDPFRALHLLKKFRLYDEDTGAFNLDGKDALDRMQQMMGVMDLDINFSTNKAFWDQRVNEFSSRQDHYNTELDSYNAITINDFKKKYNITDDIRWEDPKTVHNLITFARIRRGSQLIPLKDSRVNDSERSKYGQDLVSVLRTHYGARMITRYTAVDKSGLMFDDKKPLTDNSLFRLLDKYGKGDYGFVDLTLISGKGHLDGRADNKTLNNIIDLFYNNEAAVDKGLELSIFGDFVDYKKIGPHYVIMGGDLKWGVAIPQGKADMIAADFVKFVNKSKKTRQEDYGEVIADFEQIIKNKLTITKEPIFDDAGKEIGSKEEVSFNPSSPKMDGEHLEAMINAMLLDGNTGKLMWDHVKETRQGRDPYTVAKLARRLRMMTNISGPELSTKLLDDALRIAKDVQVRDGDNIISGLEKIKNEKMNFVVIGDEGFKISGGNDWASGKKDAKEQIEKEMKEANLEERQMDDLSDMADFSMFDSQAILNPFTNKHKALNFLSGASNVDGIGALKYHITKLGGELDSFLGKTGLFIDSRFDNFFKNNMHVDMAIMGSGSKLKSDKYNPEMRDNWIFDDIYDFDGLNRYKMQPGDNRIQQFGLENFTHMSVKGPLKEATLSYQVTNWLSMDSNREIFNWLIEPKLARYEEGATIAFNQRNPIDALAYAQYLKTNPDMSSPEGFYAWMIDAGMYPNTEMLLPEYKNQVKRQLIDNNGLMSMKNSRGGQSVATGDVPGPLRLRNSIFTKSSEEGAGGKRIQHTFGQTDLPSAAQNVKISKDNLHIVKNFKDKPDEIMTWEQFNKEHPDYDLKDREPLGTVERMMKDASDKAPENINYEVLVTLHRSPSTRPGDVILAGLREFSNDKDGNQIRVNSWDGKYRMEIDFDTDIVNWWVDTPNKPLREWYNHAGDVKHAPPDGESKKRSLRKGSGGDEYEWFNPGNLGSMRTYNMDQAKAKRLMGTVVKTQRIIEFLKESNFEINLPGIGKLKFNVEEMDAISNNMPKDIQDIVDSTTGYDNQRFSNRWFDNFAFGTTDRPGLIRLVDTKGDFITDRINDTMHRELVNQVVRPYQSLLQIGTGIFDGGKRKNVRYDDILEQVRSFDDAMSGLGRRVYWNLKRKKGVDNDLLDEIFQVETDRKGKITLKSPYGSFGMNRRMMNPKNFDNLLPFERTMAVISTGNLMKLETPQQMFGPAHARFEKDWNEVLGMGETDKILTTLVKDARNDLSLLGFVNYLDWRIGKKNKLKAEHLRQGHQGYADQIQHSILDLESLKKETEAKFINDPSISGAMASQFVYRVTGDIIHNLRTPKELGDVRFGGLEDALDWIGKKANKAKIRKYARTKPYKFQGINSAEYLTTVINNEILGGFRDMYVDPRVYDQWNVDMARDLSSLRKDYGEFWRKILKKDPYRNPMIDETNLNRLLENRLGSLFDKWELDHSGLGRLLLWKFMAPRPQPGVVTYFNGTLSEGFSRTSLGKTKLGLRMIFNSPDTRFSQLDKNNIANYFARKHNAFYDAFYGRQITKGSFEQMWLEGGAEMRDRFFSETEPLIDPTGQDFKSPDMQAETNPQIRNAFGYEDNFSIGYLLSHELADPRMVGQMTKGMQYSTMPVGYIPIDYKGKNPLITGWQTYNNAMYGDAKMLLGDVLGKNIIKMNVRGAGTKMPFRDTGSRPESKQDMDHTIDQKVNNVKCGS